MKKLSLLFVALFGVSILTACSPSPSDGILDEFATCIKDVWIRVYVMDGCWHCINQEKMFGSSFNKLNVINCSSEAKRCGMIQWTPTWVLPNADQLPGVQSLEKLSEISGCELPAEDL